MKYFIIVDEQIDFNTGALANADNQKIVSAIAAKAKEAKENGYRVIATRDTHGSNYSETQEGKNLPVPHCLKGTPGWEVIDEIKPYVDEYVDKPTFGYLGWANVIKAPEAIEMCGTVTSICCIANAVILKATFPETPISVYKDLCSDISVESHNAALTVLKAQQISVL